MTDATVTLTEAECRALDKAAAAMEQRPRPPWDADGALHQCLASAIVKLRGAEPTALDRLEAWLTGANRRDAWFVSTDQIELRLIDETPQGFSATAPTLAAAIDAALRQAEEELP